MWAVVLPAWRRLLILPFASASMAMAADTSGTVADAEQMTGSDLVVATVAYRLQVAAVDHCSRRSALPGMVVLDPSQFPRRWRAFISAHWRATKHPVVEAVVPDGPADRAGLKAGDEILQINGVDIERSLPTLSEDADDGARIAAVGELLDNTFTAGPAKLTVRRGDRLLTTLVLGTPACRSRVQVGRSAGRQAWSDGDLITIELGLLSALRSEGELSFVLAHELAHNIVGADPAPKADGDRLARSRDRELEADYWAAYIMVWSGYDPGAGVELLRRRAITGLGGLFAFDHPTFPRRLRGLSDTIVELAGKRAAAMPIVPNYPSFRARSDR